MTSSEFPDSIDRLISSLNEQYGDHPDLATFHENVRNYSAINMMFGALPGNGRRAATEAAEAEPDAESRETRRPPQAQFVWWAKSRLRDDRESQGELRSSVSTSDSYASALYERETFLPFSFTNAVTNCWLVSASILGLAPTADTLKRRYVQALNTLQRSSIPSDDDAVIISFDNDELAQTMAREGLLQESELDSYQFGEQERSSIVSAIQDSFEYIKAVDPELHDLIVQLTGTIACIKRVGSSGSVSSLIGLIWLNPSPEWTIVDYAENIVHEFIHTTIFLNDLLWTIFSKPHFHTPPDSLVVSAILKYPRGFNISFHSVYVAVGLSIFLRMAHQHERSQEVAAGLDATIPGLVRIQEQHLSGYGRSWLAAIAS
jgi:hypothetical protein